MIAAVSYPEFVESWVDAVNDGRDHEAVRLFLDVWHDWTPDDTDDRAPLPLSYFGPKVRRRLSFQNTFVLEEHDDGFIFYRENQANFEVRMDTAASRVVYVEGDIAVTVPESLAHFLLKCLIFETSFGAGGTRGAWGSGARREYDAIIERLIELHQLANWICGYGRTRFFAADGVVAYSTTDAHGTEFQIGARDPGRLNWLNRFKGLTWEHFDI